MSDADFIVIGSGPAGVSAALPLVEAGRKVLMLDGATADPPLPSAAGRKLGADLEGLSVEDGLSPKLRAPETRLATSRFAASAGVRGENFVAIGAVARGGLSRIWGAFAAEFNAADFDGWPVSHAQLTSSYARVTQRIGISGVTDDALGPSLGASAPLQPPLPLATASSLLLARHAARPGQDFLLGHARNAILSQALGGRAACDLRNDCLWGCPIGAIYDARQDLARLRRHGNFRLEDGAFVVALERSGDGWQARCADGRIFSAPRLMLAAGTLGSTKLVAPLLPEIADWPLLSNPVVATPLLLPAALRRKITPSHSLAQLAFHLRFGAGGGDYISGAVYETLGLPPSSFVNQLPLGRRAGAAAFGYLSPGLLVAATNFPGALSRNRLRFDGAAHTLTVRGGFDGALAAIAKDVAAKLAAHWRALGAFALPGGRLATPGTDAHFAGTLPMGGGGANGTSVLGELAGHAGLHIVDGAALPTLSSRHTTLTIMANADRIGAAVATVPATQ